MACRFIARHARPLPGMWVRLITPAKGVMSRITPVAGRPGPGGSGPGAGRRRDQRKSVARKTASMSLAREPDGEKDASTPTQPRNAPLSSMICSIGLTWELPV